jgi:hypothetical protein
MISPNAKYLGFPIFIHKSKNKSFEEIEDNVLNRVVGWKAKTIIGCQTLIT